MAIRLWCVVCLLPVSFLAGCGGVAKSTTPPPGSSGQFTHLYVVFPPSSGVNNQHFMSTVMTQPAIEGVTVPNAWIDTETGTPGPGTCNPVGTETCQQDALGWTHTYDWSKVDADNAQWFAARGGSKKVNILLNGIGGAGPLCLITDTCINPITPYYVTTEAWANHTAAGTEDFINANKDGCTDYLGLIASSMTRDQNGLVTVTRDAHGYSNGDTIWIGGTTPASFNIAQEKITGVQVSSNTLTISADNSFPTGMQVRFQSLGNANFLNGKTVTILSSSSTQFTAAFTHANYGPAQENSGTADPLGVQVQNATANTFQYQSGAHAAGSASTPGTVISIQQSWPVPYEAPYRTAWEAFIAAAVLHFNASPHLAQISYMRVGRSVGGEAFPYCTDNLMQLPSPNTYTKDGWLQYYTDIADFVEAQNPKMQILDPLNAAGMPEDPTYGTAEAQIAVAHHNASGQTNGFGSQGLQSSDITNYGANPQGYCASDWCGTFNTYFQSGMPLELQQESLSDPTHLTQSPTGDLRPLLPFAVDRHVTILELYDLDALLAYDPNYCVLPVPNNGLCAPGSVEIPAIILPPQDQQPYFQAVGQAGQAGGTGDGSYAAAINSAQGQH